MTNLPQQHAPEGILSRNVLEKGCAIGKEAILMNWKTRLILGVLTALAMMFLTYALPRGGAMQNAALVQFPMTVGVWAIFVLLFVKLK
jgi:hypothetical protein